MESILHLVNAQRTVAILVSFLVIRTGKISLGYIKTSSFPGNDFNSFKKQKHVNLQGKKTGNVFGIFPHTTKFKG